MKELSFLHIVLIYLVVINVFTFFMFGVDKWKAKKSKRRIREPALLGLTREMGFLHCEVEDE